MAVGAIGGCRAEVDAYEADPAVPRSAPRGVAPFDCGVRASARPLSEVATEPTGSLSVTLSGCGALAWVDAEGVARVLGPAAGASATTIAEDAIELRLARRGERAWVRLEGGWSLRSLDGSAPVYVAVDPDGTHAAGFARVSAERELAWACTREGMFVVSDAEARLVSRGARRCERVLVAAEAPVAVHIDAEWGLRSVDLALGTAKRLPEVEYVAALEEPLRLSRDGRILYHQPGEDPSLRAGVFDISGEVAELIGAESIRGGLGGIQEAPRHGHVAALPLQAGGAAILSDGYLRPVPDASLVSLAPTGDRALLARPSDVRGQPPRLLVWDLDTLEEREVATVAGLPQSALTSRGGNAVAVPLTSARSERTLERWRWDEEALLPSLSGRRSPLWVGDRGALLEGDRWGQTSLHTEDGLEVGRWSDYVSLSRGLARERLLVWTRGFRDPAMAGLFVAYSTHPNVTTLRQGGDVSAVLVDAPGEHLAYVADVPDPDDPTRTIVRLFFGALD